MSQLAETHLTGPPGRADGDEIAGLRRDLDRLVLMFDVMAHDLRSPLAAVAGFADLLADRGDSELSARQRAQILRSIRTNTARMSAILTNLSDWAQLEAGRFRSRRLFTDLEALVERVLAGMRLTGHPVEVNVVRDFDYVDPFLVERITENLVLNAARHTPPGTVVRVEVVPAPGGLELIVSDDGPGVDAELADTVFERFERGGDGDRRGGLGLGLFLVRRFAELHGGFVWLDRRARGASFHVVVATNREPGGGA